MNSISSSAYFNKNFFLHVSDVTPWQKFHQKLVHTNIIPTLSLIVYNLLILNCDYFTIKFRVYNQHILHILGLGVSPLCHVVYISLQEIQISGVNSQLTCFSLPGTWFPLFQYLSCLPLSVATFWASKNSCSFCSGSWACRT